MHLNGVLEKLWGQLKSLTLGATLMTDCQIGIWGDDFSSYTQLQNHNLLQLFVVFVYPKTNVDYTYWYPICLSQKNGYMKMQDMIKAYLKCFAMKRFILDKPAYSKLLGLKDMRSPMSNLMKRPGEPWIG